MKFNDNYNPCDDYELIMSDCYSGNQKGDPPPETNKNKKKKTKK